MICKIRFTERTNRNRHVREQHNDLEKKFACMTCGQLLCTKYAVQRHSINKHKIKQTQHEVVYKGNLYLMTKFVEFVEKLFVDKANAHYFEFRILFSERQTKSNNGKGSSFKIKDCAIIFEIDAEDEQM